jgi:hypothetical protein
LCLQLCCWLVGVAFDADISNTTDTDIKSIKVVLGGVGFNATNDKLILDTDITLSGNIRGFGINR